MFELWHARWVKKGDIRELWRDGGRTFRIAHMYNVMARVKRAILAHVVLVGAPERDVRRRRKGDEQITEEVYLAPLGLKTLHIGQTLVVT